MKNEVWQRSNDIGSIMTTQVICVAPTETMDRVKAIFDEHNIHHIPVCDQGKIMGMISKSDYYQILHGFTLFKAEKSEAYNRAILRSLLAKEVMTKQVATLLPTDSVFKAADYFRENLFHAIPIVDPEGQLIGILTTYDLINHYFSNVPVEK